MAKKTAKITNKTSDKTSLGDAIGFYNPNFAKVLLRVGLALTFLYAAVSALRTPDAWTGFVPQGVTNLLSAKTVLDTVAVLQLLIVVGLLVGRYLKLTAVVAAVLLTGILVANLNSLVVTFRDMGLACMALALVFLD
jgi:uncharacterized membrane protein YphA (DoxX/SURF4 family)